MRFLDVPLGAAIALSPLLLGGATAASAVNAVVLGIAVAALSWPRGRIRERYGGFAERLA